MIKTSKILCSVKLRTVLLVAGILGLCSLSRADQPNSELAKKMVFEVFVGYSGEDFNPVAEVVQPGFLVAEGGVGITSYNALHGASRVTAKFHGNESTFLIDLLIAKPKYDLALIRLRPEKEGNDTKLPFLERATGDLKGGQAVWTLQGSPTLDEANAIPCGSMVSAPSGRDDPSRPFDAPAWLISEGHQDRLTSGCPLVDERGRLVGISVWAWPNVKSRPFALAAAVVEQVLDEYADLSEKAKSKDQPAPVMKVSEAKQKYNDAILIGSIFPRLNWRKTENAIDLARAQASNLDESIRCPTCKGVGTDTKLRVTHGPSSKYSDGKRTEKEIKVTCTGCEGKRLMVNTKVVANCSRVASAIAKAIPGSPGYDKILESFNETAVKVTTLNGQRFRQALDEDVRKRLDLKRLQRGEAIMFVGTIGTVISEWEKDVAVANVVGVPGCSIVAIAPDGGGIRDPRQTMLVVGVVTGFVTPKTGGQALIVLDRVVAVPFKADMRTQP